MEYFPIFPFEDKVFSKLWEKKETKHCSNFLFNKNQNLTFRKSSLRVLRWESGQIENVGHLTNQTMQSSEFTIDLHKNLHWINKTFFHFSREIWIPFFCIFHHTIWKDDINFLLFILITGRNFYVNSLIMNKLIIKWKRIIC